MSAATCSNCGADLERPPPAACICCGAVSWKPEHEPTGDELAGLLEVLATEARAQPGRRWYHRMAESLEEVARRIRELTLDPEDLLERALADLVEVIRNPGSGAPKAGWETIASELTQLHARHLDERLEHQIKAVARRAQEITASDKLAECIVARYADEFPVAKSIRKAVSDSLLAGRYAVRLEVVLRDERLVVALKPRPTLRDLSPPALSLRAAR